ncbi:hypothetical protein EDC96DRAFT_548044 [Choanephora cucurbitarum]|nr:hypothetical protein EDC96DRAFT_548044 [Choanephora cucurbitarum]
MFFSLALLKIEAAAPRFSKRSLEGLKMKLGDGDEEDKTALKKFNEQRKRVIDELKDSQARNSSADLDKLLYEFCEDNDSKKKLMLINMDLEGAEERAVAVLLNLQFHRLDDLTIDKKQMNEMGVQSGLLAGICSLFKVSMKHDPHW